MCSLILPLRVGCIFLFMLTVPSHPVSRARLMREDSDRGFPSHFPEPLMTTRDACHSEKAASEEWSKSEGTLSLISCPLG